MKKCSKCQTHLPLESFSKNKRAYDGLQNVCKVCAKEYRCSEYNRKYSKKYRLDNREKLLEDKRQWSKNNRGLRNAAGSKRRARKLNATPKGLSDFDKDYIKCIYMQASHLGLEVDHIIPLQGKNVCGLHVPWNLQLLTKSENMRKGNRYDNGL